MTCIVGLVDNNTVYIGGDSAAVAGHHLTVRTDSKVFKNDVYVIGFTSSFRMGQLLCYSFKPPKPPEDPKKLHGFMVTTFVDAARQCLKNGGFATITSGNEKGGKFLVGVKGRLFIVDQDFQVGESKDNYMAIGVGMQLSEGALYATKGRPPKKRVQLALEASAKHCGQVLPPFIIKSAKG